MNSENKRDEREGEYKWKLEILLVILLAKHFFASVIKLITRSFRALTHTLIRSFSHFLYPYNNLDFKRAKKSKPEKWWNEDWIKEKKEDDGEWEGKVWEFRED